MQYIDITLPVTASNVHLKVFPGLKQHQSFFLVLTVFECGIGLLVDTASPLQTGFVID